MLARIAFVVAFALLSLVGCQTANQGQGQLTSSASLEVAQGDPKVTLTVSYRR